MGFNNFTSFPALKKPVPRVFVRPLFNDLEANGIETAQTVVSSGGWVQLFTGDGGVVVTPKRTVSKLGDQQRGNTKMIQDDLEVTLEVTVAQFSLKMLQDLLVINPAASGGKTYASLRANRGLDITSQGVSFVIYDKNYDPSNDTNTPAMSVDAETIVIYKAVPSELIAIELNAKQQTAKLTFECLASTSSGSASGSMGIIGACTAL